MDIVAKTTYFLMNVQKPLVCMYFQEGDLKNFAVIVVVGVSFDRFGNI